MTPHYYVYYEGEEYVLSLRISPDGYVPMWVRMAIQRLVKGARIGYPFVDEETTNEFFQFVLNDAGFTMSRSTGIRTPYPWNSFLDLESSTMEEIAKDFFVYWVERMKASKNYDPSTKDSEMITLAHTIYQKTLGWPSMSQVEAKISNNTRKRSNIRGIASSPME